METTQSTKETLALLSLAAWKRQELGWTALNECLAATGLSQERLEELDRSSK